MFNDNEIRLTSIEMGYLRLSNTGKSESSLNNIKVWIYTDLDKETLDAGINAYLEFEGDDVDVERMCQFITAMSMIAGSPCICLPQEFFETMFKNRK